MENLKEFIRIAVVRFSTEMTYWTRDQFLKLINRPGNPETLSLEHSNVKNALHELETEHFIIVVDNERCLFVLHPDYINANLPEYYKKAALDTAGEIASTKKT